MGGLILNGTTFHPSTIESKRPNYGTAIRSANGTPHLMKRGAKATFTITWDRVPWATVIAVSGIAGLNSTFSYTEPEGGTTTVQNTLDGWSYALSGEDEGTSGVRYYTISLIMDEV